MPKDFRAETVGSLLRPEYLKRARGDFMAGKLPPDGLKAAEDRAVDEAIALQEEVGLDVISDGEMRRASFFGPLTEALGGFEFIPGRTISWTSAVTGEPMTWQPPVTLTSKLTHDRKLAVEEYAYASARATKPVKQTLPSPLLMSGLWNAELTSEAYPDPFDALVDAANLLHEEARELAELGCEYIQIDAPEMPGWADPTLTEMRAANPIPLERLMTDGLDLVNTIAEGIEGVTFAIHLCRGNNVGCWYASAGYEDISRALFGRLTNYDAFLLEYDDERSGGFEPLADCPDDKMVVLGLVSSKLSALEEPDELVRRVEEAARFHPFDRLSLSPQCGFASVMQGNPVTEDVQRAKLQLVADVAHRLWPPASPARPAAGP
jgi:5-methyltetrahydropteroyltriglutamate--homocysteine methyltransferase